MPETSLGKWWSGRHKVTRVAAVAARRNQPCAKLIYLSIRLRAAEADRGGIIELGIISIAGARFLLLLLLLLLTGMETGFHSPFFSPVLSKLF